MVKVKECDGNLKEGGPVSLSPSVSDSDSSGDNAALNLASFQGRMTGPTRRSTKGGWTEEEDKILAYAVRKFKGKNWKMIAECVPHRTDVQCLHRWQKVLNPDLVKGFWSKEEDDLIIELVAKQGNKKWSEIARSLPGRIGKQCRERWHNHLNPEIKRTAWTKEEELLLIEAHKIYGNKWTEIAKFLQGRTENSIKNHWNSSVKKKLKLQSSHVSDLDSHKRKAHSKKPEVANQSLDQKENRERNVEACSLDLDLVLGTSNRRGSQIQSSGKGNSRWLTEGAVANKRIKTQPRTVFYNHYKNTSHRRIHKASGHCNWSHSRPPQAFLNDGLDLHSCNRTDGYFLNKPGLPITVWGSYESSTGPQADEKRKDAGATENSENSSLGRLCYKPLKREDLNFFLENGQFPSTDSYIPTECSSIPLCTRPRRDKGMSVDCNSPDSTLRSASRTFKNSPSIIRKRRHSVSRKSVNVANHGDRVHSEEVSNSSRNTPHLQV